VSDPGDLTVTEVPDEIANLAGLFDTTDTTGFFAPDLNTGNEGNWTFTVPITLTVSSITIDEIELDGAMFNNSGSAQKENFWTEIELSIVGSITGEIYSETLTAYTTGGSAWDDLLTYTPSVTLSDDETWSIIFTTTSSDGSGNNTGIDSFTVSGSIAIPEPSSAALLLGLATCGLIARRRRV
jgi:hypothetical protein